MINEFFAGLLALTMFPGIGVSDIFTEPEPEEEYVEEEYYYEDYGYYEDGYGYYEDYASYGVDEDFQFQGVREYDGRTETWYSSNVLYHKDTSEWYVDDEGYYKTEDGYYVVAASDMEEGTVFEGSKGECIVLDCGCADGVTDYYVNW